MEGHTSGKMPNVSLPPMKSEMRAIIERAEKCKYFKAKTGVTPSSAKARETIIYGNEK